MSDWSLLEREWLTVPPPLPYDPFQFPQYETYFRQKGPSPQAHYSTPSPTFKVLMSTPPPPLPVPMQVPDQQQISPPLLMQQPQLMPPPPAPPAPVQSQQLEPIPSYVPPPPGESPREMRNKAEKQRRDKLNQSIAELAAMVPPVVASTRKVDKTGVLRLTAHYLRAHQYVFGDSIGRGPQLSAQSTQAVLSLLNGILITLTYKGLIVVVSQNITEYLGYSELELLGHSIFKITHPEDHRILRQQLMPRSVKLGPNGQLLAPEHRDGRQKVADALASEKRKFTIRLQKLVSPRSEPCQYVTCYVEGSLRKSDRACHGYNRCCQMMRRARARGENPCASGNDVVFIGIVRPAKETFINESALETYCMEYRTRHSVDGEILQTEQRISLVTGYMSHEVFGVNAMNFIHKDEVRCVIVALKEMYMQNNLFGESCYRLMTKNGQFIYLRTRGKLDVVDSQVTSFVCTNTVVDEDVGKELVKMMKEKFRLEPEDGEEKNASGCSEVSDNQIALLEDPKRIEKQILDLIKNLPSPYIKSNSPNLSPDQGESQRLLFIAPEEKRIVCAIERMYGFIKVLPNIPNIFQDIITSPNKTETAPNDLYHDLYFRQNSSDTDQTSSSGSSNLEYTADVTTFNIKYAQQIYQGLDNYESNVESQCNVPDSYLPRPSTGTKRPNKFEDDLKNMSKKKVMEVVQEPATEKTSTDVSPSLETFFDEATLSQEIESAINSLDDTNDPSNMLISQELQDFLDNIGPIQDDQ